jgi:Spy/CpxP family protein refolding chaperone
MHPFAWWHAQRGGSCGSGVDCGSHHGPPRGGPWGAGRFGGHGPGPGGDDFGGGGGFGVRRPLRFLAHRLDLDDDQVAELAAILDELKTERAQAAVDDRRALSSLADAVATDVFDEAKVAAATASRAKSSERVEAAVARALGRIHKLLKSEQRSQLAYLLRTGTLSM